MIRFHSDAEIELQEAIRWYEYQRSGLSSEFLLCIDEAIEKLNVILRCFLLSIIRFVVQSFADFHLQFSRNQKILKLGLQVYFIHDVILRNGNSEHDTIKMRWQVLYQQPHYSSQCYRSCWKIDWQRQCGKKSIEPVVLNYRILDRENPFACSEEIY